MSASRKLSRRKPKLVILGSSTRTEILNAIDKLDAELFKLERELTRYREFMRAHALEVLTCMSSQYYEARPYAQKAVAAQVALEELCVLAGLIPKPRPRPL